MPATLKRKIGRVAAITCSVVIAILVLVAVVVLPFALAPASSPAIVHTPADIGLAFDNVELHPSDQPIVIRAWWIPADKPVASMLFVHGANGNREEVDFGALDYYRALHDRRLNILTIDLRNHGASDKSASGYLTFGREEQHDAGAGLNWLRAKSSGLHIFGSADSMGGSTLLQLAVAGAQFDGLVLVDPVLDNKDTIIGGLAAILGVPRAMVVPTAWSALHLMRVPSDPVDAARNLNTPILLVQDDADPVTRVEFALALAQRNRHVELRMIGLEADDAVHVGTGGWGTHASAFRRQPKRVLELIDRFLAGRIK
jgi:pimeloyl-ACP methyl ester carboxylesterase